MDCCKNKSNKSANKEMDHSNMDHSKSGKGHFWMMFGCIGIVIVFFIITYLFDFDSKYITWILLALCVGMHLFMMKGHNH
ncbi:MAG TPA: DUF2933 domain-containing protein [Bacteroidia bacterium]|nr:DUF2933 domain-containing protein [Bacteroidia bacterium]